MHVANFMVKWDQARHNKASSNYGRVVYAVNCFIEFDNTTSYISIYAQSYDQSCQTHEHAFASQSMAENTFQLRLIVLEAEHCTFAMESR